MAAPELRGEPLEEVVRMRRYLVVANQTLCGDHLLAKVRECIDAGPCWFHVVVPATPPSEHLTATQGEARVVARKRLDQSLARFRELGAEVTGEVGDARPLQAIDDVLRHRAFDEIILSTLPPGPSRWLRQDLPHRAERAFNLPITHVVAARESAAV